MDEQLISELSVGISLMILLALAMAYCSYRADNIRDKIFALRDEMFLYAYDNGLIDAPGYTHLRSLMNGLIRYGHHLSFARLISLSLCRRIIVRDNTPPDMYRDWIAAVEKLPISQREKIREFHTRSMFLLMQHLITGSIPLMGAAIVIGVWFLIVHQTKRLRERTTAALQGLMPPLNLLEVEALKTVLART